MENVRSKPYDASGRVSSRFYGAVFGYMFLGLLITAAVSLGWSYFVVSAFASVDSDGYVTFSNTGLMWIVGVCIASAVGCYLTSIVNNVYAIKTEKAPWVGFLLYAIFIGFAFSTFILTGIDFATMGEAFALTAIAFGAMFLIARFSKANLAWWSLLGLGLLAAAGMMAMFWWIIYLLNPLSPTNLFFGIVISAIVLVASLLITAFDCWKMKRIIASGNDNRNLALFCAFDLYTDFLMVFIRILYLLAFASSNRR